MTRLLHFVIAASYLCVAYPVSGQAESIEPGEIWLDTSGVHINAHGGGVLYHNGTYHWYGEHKAGGPGGNKAHAGVRVYRSDDLVVWEDAGVAFAVSDDPQSEIVAGCVIERPKVIFNETTGKFVMWFHLELKGHGYNAARTGCAVSDSSTGPFVYLGSVRPNAGRFPIGISDELKNRVLNGRWGEPHAGETKAEKADEFFARDFCGGQMARDMTLFLDDDGTAYHVFASEENYTLHFAELDETFTRHTGKYTRAFVGGHREAPAIFRRDGRYHLITSGCTGWAPNAAEHAVADSIWGPWTVTGNPCVGENAELTFGGQSTFVLPVEGAEDSFIFMADRWRPQNAIDGRYVWLPMDFENDRPVIRFRESWHPEEWPR